jgi:hypothetical protein
MLMASELLSAPTVRREIDSLELARQISSNEPALKTYSKAAPSYNVWVLDQDGGLPRFFLPGE